MHVDQGSPVKSGSGSGDGRSGVVRVKRNKVGQSRAGGTKKRERKREEGGRRCRGVEGQKMKPETARCVRTSQPKKGRDGNEILG